MSILGDYLKVVKNGIKNGDKIIEALKISSLVKNGTATEEQIAEILRRKDICATCPFNSKNAKIHGFKPLALPFQHCIHCSCRIGGDNTKEYCLSCNCGLTEWNKANPNAQIPLKWEAITDDEGNSI